MSKPNIAIVSGGYSSEINIAYQSSSNIYQLLRTLSEYNFFYLDLKPKSWDAILDFNNKECRQTIDKNDFSIQNIAAGNQSKINFDLALIMMHGSPGEDGKLQGYFDLIGQRYLACSSFASALSNHKYETNVILSNHGILTPQSILIRRDYLPHELAKQLEPFSNQTIFVKSNTGGSSIAMSRISTTDDSANNLSLIQTTIEKIFADDKGIDSGAIVEAGIQGRELTIGVYQLDQEIQTLPITEICLSENMQYFDFNAKYSGKTKEITPAPIPPSKAHELAEISKKIYTILNLSGIVRLDFIYQESSGKFFFLEVNTIPGQTQHSIIPQQLAVNGKDLRDLYAEMIELALKKS